MTEPDPVIARLLELASEGGVRPAIDLGLELLADGHPLGEVIVDVLAGVQRQVGDLWATNEYNTAQEHAATAVIDGVLGALSLETVRSDPGRGGVIVACAEGEHHTMPARMGAEMLRADGWDVTFLGGSMPPDDLQRFVADRSTDVVVVSCTVPLFLPGARRCFAAVGERGTPTIAAGAAFGSDASRALRLGARGWLGPGMALAEALDRMEPEPLRVPAPPEALSLELDRDVFEASCLAAMFERMPVMSTCSPAELGRTRTDVGYILGFLCASVDLDEDAIFEDFVAWLSSVLRSRDVAAAVLDETLQIVGEVLGAAGMVQAARLCAVNREAVESDPPGG